MAGELDVFGQEYAWFLRDHDENIERQRAGGIFGKELAFGAGEIKCAEWLVEVKSPACGADEPWDGNAPAVRA